MRSEYCNIYSLELRFNEKVSRHVDKELQYERSDDHHLYQMMNYNKRLKELYVGEHEYHNVPLGWLKENSFKCTHLLVWNGRRWE